MSKTRQKHGSKTQSDEMLFCGSSELEEGALQNSPFVASFGAEVSLSYEEAAPG